MERLKRNPGVLGLAVGGLAVILSTFLTWLKLTNVDSGAETRIRAASTYPGQTLMLLGFLLLLCGFGVLASGGGGRIWWAALGFITAAGALAACLWGLFDPQALASQMAKTTTVQNLGLAQTGETAKSAMDAAFASGKADATVAIGLFVGLVASALTFVGAVLSFRKPAQPRD